VRSDGTCGRARGGGRDRGSVAVDRASAEAAALGLTNPSLKTFALDYIEAHKPRERA
jgi:hypothetical protein